MRLILLLFFLSAFAQTASTQDSPSLVRQAPAVSRTRDTVKNRNAIVRVDSIRRSHDSLPGTSKRSASTRKLPYLQTIRTNPYLHFTGAPRYELSRTIDSRHGDELFYMMTGFVLIFALIRLIFWKYFDNLFSVIFRVSLKQKQMREQLIQSPLPSLLLNLFFAISGGLYIAFLIDYYHVRVPLRSWQIVGGCVLALASIYLLKFLLLKLMGWIFNISEATDTYIFIVFLINKLLGILLIPALILMAFSGEPFVSIVVIVSLVLVVIFFLYRYIVAYEPVRKEVRVSQAHFIIYLCAFELAPLLLIYKVLLTFLGKST